MKNNLNHYFDYKIGIAGAAVMGITVFCINYFITYVAFDSMIASTKQASYTFFLGGFFMKGAEYIAVHIKKFSLAMARASASRIGWFTAFRSAFVGVNPLASPRLTPVFIAYFCAANEKWKVEHSAIGKMIPRAAIPQCDS